MKTWGSRAAGVLLILSALVAGCHRTDSNAKVTAANLAKIHPDMTLAEVEEILGTGESVQNSFTAINNERVPVEQRGWTEGERSIFVVFQKGKVLSFAGQHL